MDERCGDFQRVVIDPSTPKPVQVLLDALADTTTPALQIELCDVELDLTGHRTIAIWSCRRLIASPDCERGPRRLGPRIFVTDTRGGATLFDIKGDNVVVSGFRLEGPTSVIGQGDDVLDKGITISPSDGDEPIRSIEISNMEIFHWSGVGVQVVDNVNAPNGGASSTRTRAPCLFGTTTSTTTGMVPAMVTESRARRAPTQRSSTTCSTRTGTPSPEGVETKMRSTTRAIPPART